MLYNGAAGIPVSAFDLNPPLDCGGEMTSVALVGSQVVIEFKGNLRSAAIVTGPYSPVAGATSPNAVAPTQPAAFYAAQQEAINY